MSGALLEIRMAAVAAQEAVAYAAEYPLDRSASSRLYWATKRLDDLITEYRLDQLDKAEQDRADHETKMERLRRLAGITTTHPGERPSESAAH